MMAVTGWLYLCVISNLQQHLGELAKLIELAMLAMLVEPANLVELVELDKLVELAKLYVLLLLNGLETLTIDHFISRHNFQIGEQFQYLTLLPDLRRVKNDEKLMFLSPVVSGLSAKG